MRKKVLLTRKLHPFAMQELKKKFAVKIHAGEIPMPKNELISQIRDVEGLVCFPYDKIDKTVIDAADNLKVISTYSVGFDHIDIQHAKNAKIRVGYTPKVLTDATAELTMAIILDVLRRVSEGDRVIRNGLWQQIYSADEFVGSDVRGKTLGILGLGRIGEAVVKRAGVFGMKIIYHNRTRLSGTKEGMLGVKFASFEKLIGTSDVISLHVPHTKDTEKIIDYTVLKQMKKTAFLINTARGKIINEKDLIKALEQKEIAGAALDVFENEPISKNHRLTKLENVVLVPHIGSSTRETREKMAEVTLNNLKLGINGKRPVYSVGY